MSRAGRWARRWYAAWRASRLGTRLAFGLGAVALVVFAIVGTLTVGLMQDYLSRRLDDQLKTSQVSQVPHLRTSTDNPETVYSWYSAVFAVSNGSAVMQPGGALPSDPQPLVKVAEEAAKGDIYRTVYLKGEGDYRVRACPVDTDEGGTGTVLLSAAPQADLDNTVRQLVFVEVVAFLIALTILVMAGRLVLRRGLRPLADMAGTAHDIASHDLTATANLPVRASGDGGGAEVEELRTAFNLMLSHIEASLAARTVANERLRRFVADASHELRTPLTSIRGYADLFQYAAANEPAEREAHLSKIRAETARMSVLVDDLLLLARLDSHDAEHPVRPEQMNVTELATAAADAFRAGRPHHPLTTRLPDDAVVLQADPMRVRQVMDNLLANAAVHTPDGTPVELSLSIEGGEAVVRVTDAGPGITPEDQQRIFDRFYRVDNSRTRAAGGTGLGLSVVHSLVVEHGGAVSVESQPGRTTFTVRLPR
ncbi:sensor histidine kinase [Amycolatopsis jiangsuensis]|uniref:histidine kinase n=1 Tax=Amycolatopsis jiangsuensis TaxID=1181879 RepID=A0A840IW83_9PSEU|nr:HAMP domain-containing sensor histidine kinase [Amycolatopsis jiangsuensis]MBB4685472.1 two-component system OmpR family sensor kinase [Amycolatopsis jiangsuensis]